MLGGSSKSAYRIIMGQKIPIRSGNEPQKPEVKHPATNPISNTQQKLQKKTNPPQASLLQKDSQPKPEAQTKPSLQFPKTEKIEQPT